MRAADDAAAESGAGGRWRAAERVGQWGRGGMDDIVPGAAGGIPAALGQEADAARGYVQRSTKPAGPPGVAG